MEIPPRFSWSSSPRTLVCWICLVRKIRWAQAWELEKPIENEARHQQPWTGKKFCWDQNYSTQSCKALSPKNKFIHCWMRGILLKACRQCSSLPSRSIKAQLMANKPVLRFSRGGLWACSSSLQYSMLSGGQLLIMCFPDMGKSLHSVIKQQQSVFPRIEIRRATIIQL